MTEGVYRARDAWCFGTCLKGCMGSGKGGCDAVWGLLDASRSSTGINNE